MLDKNSVLFWNEVEHDLYEENDYVFGVELDLFNGHKSYYYKVLDDGKLLFFDYLDDDIYKAIEQFNAML
jgi:hypothetical protein